MSDSGGYISIHRKITNHWIFEKTKPKSKFEAWLIMLMEVNHSEQKVLMQGEFVLCKRGESLKSLDTWAKLFNWDKSKVRRFFKLLESDSMIVLKSTQKTTHLSICNYDSYQSNRNTDETQMKRKRNTDETRMTLNNNDNNDNNYILPDLESDLLKKNMQLNSGYIPGKKNRYTKTIEERTEEFADTLEEFEGKYPKDMLIAFGQYWVEAEVGKDTYNARLRWQMEKTWKLSSRLAQWERNNKKWK